MVVVVSVNKTLSILIIAHTLIFSSQPLSSLYNLSSTSLLVQRAAAFAVWVPWKLKIASPVSPMWHTCNNKHYPTMMNIYIQNLLPCHDSLRMSPITSSISHFCRGNSSSLRKFSKVTEGPQHPDSMILIICCSDILIFVSPFDRTTLYRNIPSPRS